MKADCQMELEPKVAISIKRESLAQRTGLNESGRLTRLFLMSAGWIFLLTAAIKFMSAMQEARVLGRPDPLLEFLSTRQLLALTALLEAGVAVVILWAGRAVAASEKLLLVLWLAMMFLLYRLGLWWIGHQGGCNCMGNAAQWLGASAATLDSAAKVLLAYLLLGSFALLTTRTPMLARRSMVLSVLVLLVVLLSIPCIGSTSNPDFEGGGAPTDQLKQFLTDPPTISELFYSFELPRLSQTNYYFMRSQSSGFFIAETTTNLWPHQQADLDSYDRIFSQLGNRYWEKVGSVLTAWTNHAPDRARRIHLQTTNVARGVGGASTEWMNAECLRRWRVDGNGIRLRACSRTWALGPYCSSCTTVDLLFFRHGDEHP
jgi:hypothetical protein